MLFKEQIPVAMLVAEEDHSFIYDDQLICINIQFHPISYDAATYIFKGSCNIYCYNVEIDKDIWYYLDVPFEYKFGTSLLRSYKSYVINLKDYAKNNQEIFTTEQVDNIYKYFERIYT